VRLTFYGMSLRSVLLHPIRTLKWIVKFVPMFNQLKRGMSQRQWGALDQMVYGADTDGEEEE
jgi:hypothetical protein